MRVAVSTPMFDDDEDGLAAFQALFNRPPYNPAEALAKALALLPDHHKQSWHWLPLALICANSSINLLLDLILDQYRDDTIIDWMNSLSSGEMILAHLALHLYNDNWELPGHGLTNLRLLDDWHFELAMHAIRIHSRGAR